MEAHEAPKGLNELAERKLPAKVAHNMESC